MSLFNFFKKRKVILINGTLTVSFVNGTQLVMNDCSESDFNFMNDKSHSDEELVEYYYNLLTNKKESSTKTTISQIIEKKEEKKKEEVKKVEEARQEIVVVKEVENNYPSLLVTGDFSEEDGKLYMNTLKGVRIPLSLPELLVKEFINLIIKVNNNDPDALDEYIALKNFWYFCSLNPSAEAREDLFKYIKTYNLKVNKHGMFFAYRKVDKVENDSINSELSEFISNSYLKIKAAKKGPKNFIIGSNELDEYVCIPHTKELPEDYDDIGNLYDLYLSLSTHEDTQTYTDNYTHSMKIKIGEEVSMPPEECDWSNRLACSAGLHCAGSQDFGCGDTSILILINPAKVVALAHNNAYKLRVWAYLPIAVLEGEEFLNILKDINTLEIGEEYYKDQIDKLQEMLANNTPKELYEHKLIPQLSKEVLEVLNEQLSTPEEILKSRIINI